MKAIKVNTVITRVSAKANNSAGLSLSTPMLNEEELLAILRLKDKDCETLFVPIAKHDEEIIKIDSGLQSKSQSQRIRNCLFVWWEKSGKTGKFNDWYSDKTELIIEWIKQKFD